ncbi:MAG: succinate dehydrogenase, cytochrome b556 subunit [Bauldia sp.]
MVDVTGGRFRPLSPHLAVYRWSGTMAMSIAHRITGVALLAGVGLLTWWLVAAAAGPDQFVVVNAFLGSVAGRVILIAFTWALVHHLVSGIRRLVWDSGSRMKQRARDLLAWGTLATSVVLTGTIWALAAAIR